MRETGSVEMVEVQAGAEEDKAVIAKCMNIKEDKNYGKHNYSKHSDIEE